MQSHSHTHILTISTTILFILKISGDWRIAVHVNVNVM